MIDHVLTTGLQPLAPHRLTRWEFKFYTVEEARDIMRRAGFRPVDVMSIGPVARMDNAVVSAARRDRRSWESLLELEERVGRREGVRETGDGFLVAAMKGRA